MVALNVIAAPASVVALYGSYLTIVVRETLIRHR